MFIKEKIKDEQRLLEATLSKESFEINFG